MFELIAIALVQLATLTGTPTDSKTSVNTTTQPTTPGSGTEGGFGGWGHDVTAGDGGFGGWGHDINGK